MSRFCKKCGAQLLENAQFCMSCGTKTPVLQENENVCLGCGSPLRKNLKFCTACGKPVAVKLNETVETGGGSPAPDREKTVGSGIVENLPGRTVGASRMLTSAAMAANWPGEMLLQSGMDIFGSAKALSSVPGMLQTMKQGLKGLGNGFKEVASHPLKLVPALVLALLWLIVILLPSLGVTIPFSGFLSWLTFARGGLTGGVGALIGGTIGKGLFAGMVTALILPLFSRKNPFVGGMAGLKQWAGALLPKDLAGVSLLLLGIGFGLIVNNFFTGNNSLQNSMLGIVMTLSMLRVIGSKGGLIKNLATGLVQKILPKSQTDGLTLTTNRVLAGMASGTALGVLVSVLRIPWIGYALGGLLALVGLPLIIIASQQKKGAQS